MENPDKQLVLKPLDLLVALKVGINAQRCFLLSELSQELAVAVSLVHGAVRRAEQARLLTRASGNIRASREALSEFVIHGAKYCFPGRLAGLARGMPTAIGGPGLAHKFAGAEVLPPVWPHPEGTVRGPSVLPLHPSVPDAARMDPALYEVLSLLDALRVGAARERDMASAMLEALL